jgi:thioredoxin reductase
MTRIAIGLGAILLLAGASSARTTQLPSKFTNLQVVPKDISGADLVNAMKGFTRALGVRCEHCHVGEGNDLSKFDFAADTKPTKVTARKMLQMTAKLNDAVKDIGEPSTTPKITCFTCHRGAVKPATAAGGGT